MKNLNIYKLSAICASLFSIVFCIMLINIFKVSYAIDEDPADISYPTDTFRIGQLTGSTGFLNLVQAGLNNNSGYENFIENFNVTKDLFVSDNSLPVYILEKNLEVPRSTESFELNEGSNGQDRNPSYYNDRGISYIINHGFNYINTSNTVFNEESYGDVSDNYVKQYITQVAIWLYIFENKNNYTSTFCAPSSKGYSMCDFIDKTGNGTALSDSNTLRTMIENASKTESVSYLKYITKLVDNAKEYVKEESKTPNVGTITSSFTYKVINDSSELFIQNIYPSITAGIDNFIDYEVSLEDPNSYGAFISDSRGNKMDNTSQLRSAFSIVIPLQDDITKMDLTSIKVKVIAHFAVEELNSYKVTNSTEVMADGKSPLIVKNDAGTEKFNRFSDICLGYTDILSRETEFNLKNIVQISKIDATNSKELPGASLVVTNKDNPSEKWEWVSTNTPHYVTLDEGKYSLCETIAPEGYQLSTECVDFEVSNNKIENVQMKNTLVPVPNTKLSINKIIYIIGFTLILFGIGIVIYFTFNYKQIKNKKI